MPPHVIYSYSEPLFLLRINSEPFIYPKIQYNIVTTEQGIKKMEIYRTHEDKNRKNENYELRLFMDKIKRALIKMGDDYCDWLTLIPETYGEDANKTMEQLLIEKGTFFYQQDGVTFDFQWDSHIYIYINENWE